MPRLACISIDLVGLVHSCRLASLDERDLSLAGVTAVGTRAAERFGELLDRKLARGTFFVVGEDLDDEATARAAAELASSGHELASLGASYDHGLARRTAAQIDAELSRGAAAIAAIARAPQGFHSPAGGLSGRLLEALERQGYLYDASVLPSPPRHALKAATSPLGKEPILPGGSGESFAPAGPYRPSPRDPYRRGTSKLIELPLATAPLVRLPLPGSWIVDLPRSLVAALYRNARAREFLQLRWDGSLVLDETDGVPAALARRVPGLGQPAATKLQRLSELLDWLREDYELDTLACAARRLAPELP